MTMMIVMMVACVVSLALYTAMNLSVRVKLAGNPLKPCRFPPVSILKPLCGLDDGLYENLKAIVEQDYPEYEVLFGAESVDDPAIAVARRIQREYPAKRITILAGFSSLGLNPKINNVTNLANAAGHDLVLISDSNVRPDSGYLKAIVSEMSDEKVELVSSLLVGRGEKSLGSTLENLHLNTVVAGGVCGMDKIAGQSLVVGKSMLFRLSKFRSMGGFRKVRNILAEDFVIGKMYEKAGYRVALSAHPLTTCNESWSVTRFLSRQTRWAQLRRCLFPFAYFLEPLSNPIMVLLATLGAAMALAPAHLAALGAAVTGGIIYKTILDAMLIWKLRGERPALSSALLLPVKDCIMMFVWFVAAFKKTVTWRGHKAIIGAGTVLRPCGGLQGGINGQATGEAA